MCVSSKIVYKLKCGRCNAIYYGKICCNFKVRVGEQSGISPLTNKQSKSKKLTVVKDHMLMCYQLVSVVDDVSVDVKVRGSSNSEFHLKIKESLLISLSQPILNKNGVYFLLYLFDQLNKYFTAFYHYVVIFIIHRLLFTFFCFQ